MGWHSGRMDGRDAGNELKWFGTREGSLDVITLPSRVNKHTRNFDAYLSGKSLILSALLVRDY